MKGDKRLLAGIDAGGTTFKLGVADAAGRLLDKTRIPTRGPEQTLAASASALRQLERKCGGQIAILGVASFGPVDVDHTSPGYGTILETPKPGWSGAPLKSSIENALGVRAVIETDVNAALIAEGSGGAARDCERSAYVTIGTGVGVGVRIDGVFAGRPYHPEFGHIRVERHGRDGRFPGVCAIHGACLEGLLSAPALVARFGELETLPENDPCWEIAAWYLAQLCLALMLAFRLQRIVIGGGVMNAPSLLAITRKHYVGLLGAYLREDERDAERVIVKAALGDNAGLAGAIELARRLERQTGTP